MTVETYGVVAADVRNHHLPHMGAFSADSAPTATTVAEMITKSASILAGKLAAEGVTVDATAGTAAYVWCADAILIQTAIRVWRAGTGQNPELLEALKEDLAAMWKDLEERGAEALGAGADGSSTPGGPDSHITEYSLTTDTAEDMSTAVPKFRRDDPL